MPVYQVDEIEGYVMKNGKVFCHKCYEDNGEAIDSILTMHDLQDEQSKFQCDGPCGEVLPVP